MQPLNQIKNRIVLRFEQDQGRDLWIPEEDEDCIPHKQTHNFLIFLGKDPDSENFGLKTSEFEEIVSTRFAIELKQAKGAFIENICTAFSNILIWKDHLRNRFVGIKRNKFGRYSDLATSSSKERLKEKLLGLEVRKDIDKQ